MIKKIWDAIHFGRFNDQWRNDPPSDTAEDTVELGKTLFYHSYLQRAGDGWQLVTERGGILGHYMFWVSLPIYLAFAIGIATGAVQLIHFVLMEAFFIVGFGYLNGLAIHKLAQDPSYGVEELSLHRIQKA